MERRDCMLQMDELYFSSFDFEQSREDSNTEYDVSFHIEYAKNKKDSAKFPYIRSQISLLTTQPGLHPVMLPPMNINALLDSTEEA